MGVIDDDPQATRDRVVRRLSVWSLAALGGGCALTGFFAAQAATGFTGSNSSNDTFSPAIATTPTTPTAPTTRPRTVTGPTTTLAPSTQVPIQPPQGGVRRSGGRTAGRSGGS